MFVCLGWRRILLVTHKYFKFQDKKEIARGILMLLFKRFKFPLKIKDLFIYMLSLKRNIFRLCVKHQVKVNLFSPFVYVIDLHVNN